jgi:hypothetical protein
VHRKLCKASIALSLIAIAGCSSPDAMVEPGTDADASSSLDARLDDGDAFSIDSAAQCGFTDWGDDACTSCTAKNCCDVQSLCIAVPTCAPLDGCWSACSGDASCERACGDKYIDAISNYNAIINCQLNACSSPCGRNLHSASE